MSDDADHISTLESETLEAESREAWLLDEQLVSDLHGAALSGAVSSARYLRALGARPRLAGALEERLVRGAKDGDRRAREELVEAFLPLIAGVARVYRGSHSITRIELM
jgi:DNA-directed RNA polymerase sigma subunit (sigma70/sigma32)